MTAPSFQKRNRSAFVNFLRAKYETYTGAVTAESYPYYLCLDPSDKCQLRCPTCPTGVENESRRQGGSEVRIFRDRRPTLAPDLFDAVLDEMGEYLFLINFYNYGEPLLNKHLPAFVRRAKTFDIETEVHSNLSLPLSDQFIEDLLCCGLDRLEASIDGFSQETYQVHRVGGDLALVKNNLERLARTRDRLGLKTGLTYNFLIFSHNEHELADAQRYCDDIGVRFNGRDAFIHNVAWLPSHRRGEQPSQVPEELRLRSDASRVWSPPLPMPSQTGTPPACAWHHGFTVVTAGGSVAPCCAAAKETDDFGVIIPGHTRFADVWNNDRYRTSRSAFAGVAARDSTEETICSHCPYPQWLHHLYSLYDARVITQFHRVFTGASAQLERGFDLLSQCRYGLSLDALVSDGAPGAERLFVGHENAAGTAPFVAYFERNIRTEPQ
jgi:MoaA/NifB/PqqE/SkfB family radical SAM enzyme